MNKRSKTINKIFVSSTGRDLQDHRKLVLHTLASLQQRVVAMEYFGSRDGDPVSECIKLVRSSDIFIIILGMRYGSTDNAGISITQREYETAFQDEKVIRAYLIDENEHYVLPKNIDIDENSIKLRRFREILLENHICGFFKSSEDLCVRIVVDLVKVLDLPETEQQSIEKSLESGIPDFLGLGGYSIGLSRDMVNFSEILKKTESGIVFTNSKMNNLVTSGYIVKHLIDGNFNILRNTLTFDAEIWELIVLLSNYYSLDHVQLADAIAKTSDPLHLRMLISLAGWLQSETCAEAMCNRYVTNFHLDKYMKDLRVSPYSIKDTVRDALSRMSINIKPIVVKYLDVAKMRKHWQAKRMLEQVLNRINT